MSFNKEKYDKKIAELEQEIEELRNCIDAQQIRFKKELDSKSKEREKTLMALLKFLNDLNGNLGESQQKVMTSLVSLQTILQAENSDKIKKQMELMNRIAQLSLEESIDNEDED